MTTPLKDTLPVNRANNLERPNLDELIDILDDKGNYTGQTALKSVAHAKGLFHPTIHVWCYTDDGHLLLQQRGKHKETYPLKWDVSVAGHIGAGETPELGAFRECQEELGVTIVKDQLVKLQVYKKEKKHPNGIFDREFTHVFLYRLDKSTPLIKQESEVEALQWISITEFKSWIAEKHQGLIPNSEERFGFVLSAIKKRLTP